MQKLARMAQIGFVAAFMLFLAVMCGATCSSDRLDRTYSYFENRLLAQRPELSKEAVLDGSYFSKLEDYLSDHVAGRDALVCGNTLVSLAVGRPVINEVVVREDILLPWKNYETVDEGGLSWQAGQIAQNLQSIHELVTSYGGEYYYVAIPCQYVYHEDRYPSYMNNRSEYTRLSMECLRRALGWTDVSFIDMGEVFDGLGHPDEFSSAVDNHYSIRGAYVTYRTIMKEICRGNEGIPVLMEEDFSYTQVEKPYQGSRVRKLLNLWQCGERLSYLTLNDSVPFTRADNGQEVAARVYTFPAQSDQWVTYNMYMGGDIPNTVIDTGRDELPSILIYGDSFTNALECIIYWSFNEMHSLDLRYTGADVSLKDYIETCHPDYVVCIRDYEALLTAAQNGVGVN